jgi:hypothetical protein
MDQARFDAPPDDLPDSERQLNQVVAAAGEPFVGGFVPEALERELRALGYRVLEDCSDVELLRRYDPSDKTGLVARETSRIVHARVA